MEKTYSAVVDIEGIVLSKGPCIVEQLGLVIVDGDNQEIVGRKYWVRQTLSAEDISAKYGVDMETVARGIQGYVRTTGDAQYVHKRGIPWSLVKSDVLGMIARTGATVYAKGAGLERRVLNIPILELVDYGCPKYPGEQHDPLSECRFFAKYIPRSVVV